jgi:hypothetical protein
MVGLQEEVCHGNRSNDRYRDHPASDSLAEDPLKTVRWRKDLSFKQHAPRSPLSPTG